METKFSEEQAEHLALRAAEIGDSPTESVCDEFLAGQGDGRELASRELASIVNNDEGYREWMDRGWRLGWGGRR